MGTPLPPNEPGVTCSLCWGLDEAFGDSPTPRVMQVQYSGIQPGQYWDADDEQWILTPHYLLQTANPCFWTEGVAGWVHYLEYNAVSDLLQLRKAIPFGLYFNANIAAGCHLTIYSDLTSWSGVAGYGGQAEISYNTEGLT